MGIMGSFLVSNFSLETVNEYSKTGLLAISYQLSAKTAQPAETKLRADS
jgi:hypothetical protein